MQQFASVDALLSFVEGQSYCTRCKTLLDVGRAAVKASDAPCTTLQRIIAELADPAQVHYHRLLAAYALCGVFAQAKLQAVPVPVALWHAAVAVLHDPSERVARLVMAPLILAAATLTPPQQPPVVFSPAAFLASARLPQFKSFVLKLRQCGQQEVLVDVYTQRTITDPVKLQYLLGSFSPADFEQLPDEDQALLDTAALRLLCQHHGAWVSQFLSRRVQDQVRATKVVDALWKRHVLQAFGFLSTHGAAPHALALFTSTAHLLRLSSVEVQHLLSQYFIRAFPAEVGAYLLDGDGAAMLASFEYPLKCALSRRAVKRLTGQSDLILRMMEKGILPSARENPPHLPIEVRQRIYDTQRGTMTSDNGVMSAYSIEQLPRAEDRAAEAKANYAHREVQDDLQERTTYLRFLPFPDALKMGKAFVTSNDVDIRISVVEALIGGLRYSPEHVGDVLDFCLKRTKEQDPWKVSMYQAWNLLPSGFWCKAAAHVPDATLEAKIDELFEATYSAKDLSDQTLRFVQDLLCRLVGPHPDFALPRLVRQIRKRGDFDGGYGVLRPFNYVAFMYPQVLPRLATELLGVALDTLQKNDAHLYEAITSTFLSIHKEPVTHILFHRQQDPAQQSHFRNLVKKVLDAGLRSNFGFAARASFQWHHHFFPCETMAILPALLKANLDWVTEEPVQEVVCNTLQGPLLDRFVDFFTRIPTGRFYHTDNDNRRYLCRLPLSRAYRWTARQQATYAASLLNVLYSEKDVDLFDARTFVSSLARLPSVSSTTAWTGPDGVSHSLVTLATESHFEHGDYLKGFALQTLGYCEGDTAALEVLQRALDVQETRVEALRALARTLRRASGTEAVRALEPILTGKHVTAQKEALYLLGSKCDEAAFTRLVQFAADQRLPMPAVDTEGRAAVDAGAEGNQANEATSPLPMHRDVRTALVVALFHYLNKAQVWAYYDRLVEWDSTGVEVDTAAADNKTESAEEEEEVEEAEEDCDAENEDDTKTNDEEEGEEEEEEKFCPSSAACEAMTKLPWTDLRLPWQLSRYQALLAALLHHPKRLVRVAALDKLASMPPYTNLEMCKDAGAYLDDCTNPRLVRSALRCMMACTAEETVLYVASSILQVPEDPSLKIITNVLTSLTASADMVAQPKYERVVEAVIAGLTAALRQPSLIVRLIYALAVSQLAPQLTALEDAGLLHVGAAHVAVNLVRESNVFLRDKKEAEAFEVSTLRCSPSALLRRIGLEIILQCSIRDGWTEERRAAVTAYQHDSDLWVSSDALVVRMT